MVTPDRRTFLSAAAATAAATAAGIGAGVAGPAHASPSGHPGGHPGGPHGGGRPDEWPEGPGRPNLPQEPGRELRSLLAQVDPDRLRASVDKLVSFGTRHTLSSQDDPVRGIGAARDWLFATMSAYAARSGGRMTVEKQAFVQPVSDRIPAPTTITNVVATIRGSDPGARTYVVSGHYDSRVTDVMDATSDAPGADDDASGVAVVLELARLLAGTRPRATIVLAAVAAEEQGLYGSAHLAQVLRDAGSDVQAMFTNDIVGSPTADDGTRDPYSVRLFAEGVPTSETPEQAAVRRSVGGENDSPSRQLARFVTEVAENRSTRMQVRVVYRRDRYLRGGDHIPFLERGFPAARFTEPDEDYAHQHQDVRVEGGVQYGDLAEFCDFDYVARVARVNLATTWSLAMAPGTPTGAGVVTSNLTNDTELVWDAVPGASRYEVVWRPTVEEGWTHVIDAGTATSATIDLSKDNAFFGVRAVDAAGLRSPAAYPLPRR